MTMLSCIGSTELLGKSVLSFHDDSDDGDRLFLAPPLQEDSRRSIVTAIIGENLQFYRGTR
jgi:hypothetical protein